MAPSGTKAVQSKKDLTEDQKVEVQEAFVLFDTDKDVFINYHEFKVAMRALGFDKSKADVQALMQEYSESSPSSPETISLDTFFQIMKKLILAQDPTEEVLKAFKLFDSDETGKISFKNLRQVSIGF